MIVSAFLNITAAFFIWLLSFLPTGSLPIEWGDGIEYFWAIINSFSYVLPISAFLGALVFVLGFEFALLAWHFIQWTLRKIPGVQ